MSEPGPTKEDLLQMMEDDFQKRMREREEQIKAQSSQGPAPAEVAQAPGQDQNEAPDPPRPPQQQQTLNIVRGERIAPGQVVRLLWRDGNSLAIYPADFKIKTIHPNGRVALKLVK